MKTERLGEYSFLLGILLAIVAGLFIPNELLVSLALVVLGLVVGLINIVRRESMPFLVASIALIVAGSAGLEYLPLIGVYLEPMLLNIKAFVAPAAVIVALKAVYELGKKR